jgi:hypothetical protein
VQKAQIAIVRVDLWADFGLCELADDWREVANRLETGWRSGAEGLGVALGEYHPGRGTPGEKPVGANSPAQRGRTSGDLQVVLEAVERQEASERLLGHLLLKVGIDPAGDDDRLTGDPQADVSAKQVQVVLHDAADKGVEVVSAVQIVLGGHADALLADWEVRRRVP